MRRSGEFIVELYDSREESINLSNMSASMKCTTSEKNRLVMNSTKMCEVITRQKGGSGSNWVSRTGDHGATDDWWSGNKSGPPSQQAKMDQILVYAKNREKDIKAIKGMLKSNKQEISGIKEGTNVLDLILDKLSDATK